MLGRGNYERIFLSRYCVVEMGDAVGLRRTLGWVWVGRQVMGCVVIGLRKVDFGGLGRTLDGIGTGTFIVCSGTAGVCSRKAEYCQRRIGYCLL